MQQSISAAQHKRMMETPIPHLVTSLALPTVISQLITVIYNTADTWFVARISTSASAAVGVVFSLQALIQAIGFGIGMGANSLISRKLGAKEDDQAFRYASSAVFAALIFGLLLLVLGLPLLPGFMRLLGSTETILPYACQYAKYILFGAPVMCVAFVINNILRSEGDPLFAMWGLMAGGLLNIILDPLLIFTFQLGIAGAAIATVLSQCVALIILLSVFLRGKSIVKLSPRLISWNPEDYFLIFRTGIPTVCRQGLGSLSSALLNIAAAGYGDAAVAAMTISGKIYMLARLIVVGIGQGFQPVAGYNYGAGNRKRVREAFRFSCQIGTAICLIVLGFLLFFAPSVIGLFLKDPEVIRIGTGALYFICISLPLLAYSTYVNQLLQCLGFSGAATFLASCRQGIFFVPLVFLLPGIFGIAGIEMLQPAADFCTFLVSIPFQVSFFRKHLK